MANFKLTRSTCGAQPVSTPLPSGTASPPETYKRVMQRSVPPYGAQPDPPRESEDDMERAGR